MQTSKKYRKAQNSKFFVFLPHPSGRFTMGQNLALIWSSGSLDDDRDSDFPGRIRKWFDEVKKYSFGAKFSLATGHYMQVRTRPTSLW